MADINILIRARDLASKSIQNVNRELGKTGKLGKGLRTTSDNLTKLGVIGAGVAAAGIVASIKAAADFESQLNTINTVAAVTPEKLQAIGDGIRKIARDTGTPLEELTQGYYDLVSGSIAAEQAQRVLTASNTLAIGGLATAAEAVDLVTTALNSYGVSAKDQGAESERFADIFAKSIERGRGTAADLAGSFAQVGPLAASMGIEIEELAAGYASLTSKGAPAAEAATQMNAAMTSLIKKSGPLKKLEKQTGRNYEAIAGKKGLAFAFEQMGKDADKAGVPLIELVGRKEALAFALGTTGDAMDTYTANLAAMQDADGTAARQMASRSQGLNFQLGRLKAMAQDAGIMIGSKLLPKLTPLAEKAVAWLETHQGEIDKFGDSIAGAFERAGEFAAKIPWGTIGSGLKTSAEWAGKLMEAFLSMPAEVQTTIIALAGLNKLSGGAVGGIVSALGTGLIKGVLGMTAGTVHIKAGIVTGAGGGPPIPGGGGALSFLGNALKVSVVGAVVVAGLEVGASLVGLNDPRHQTGKPPGKFNSTTFRGTNVPSEQIANLERGLGNLEQRAAGGDALAARQLKDVQAEIRSLRGPLERLGPPTPINLTPSFASYTTVTVNMSATQVRQAVVNKVRMGKIAGSYGGGRGFRSGPQAY